MPSQQSEIDDQRIGDQRAIAEIRLHRALALAHDDYAKALIGLVGDAEIQEAPAIRGSLQRRIVALPDIATVDGMTSREVAKATTGDEPNCHTALKGLAARDIVEIVTSSTPQRFRLAAKHRRDRVLRLSRLVTEREWTTYGDFSIAVYDSSRMALAVASAAANNPAFANPHRLVQSGGSVSSKWKDEDGELAPEQCKDRLREEHVWDDARDRTTDGGFVGWEELRARLAVGEAEDEGDVAA